MQIQGHDIGVCSWSLRPANIGELIGGVQGLGLSHLQLALAPLLGLNDADRKAELGRLRDAGLQLTATMISFAGEDYSSIAKIHQTGGYLSTETWKARKQITADASKLTAELGVPFLTTHIGFVPTEGASGYKVMLDRIREIAALLHRDGITLLLETGQEKAGALREFLEDLDAGNVGVNFDPANMILYGAGDPIEAISVLGRFIRHVHVKDATASNRPGIDWGEEVPFGAGQVGPARFLWALHKAGYHGPLVIEREAGEQRADDVKAAIAALQKCSS